MIEKHTHLFCFGSLRTNNFHHFVKIALTKNPKKRPTADRLLQVRSALPLENIYDYHSVIFLCITSLFLQHPFVTQPLSRTLAIELLDKANNPDHSTHSDAEEDDIDPEVMSYI